MTTRAYIGDVAGRMFRVDLSGGNPEDWSVQLAYDPCEGGDSDGLKGKVGESCSKLQGTELSDAPRPFGPSSFKPALSVDNERNLVVVYGLGERTDTSVSDQIQAMIALREKRFGATANVQPQPIWTIPFPETSAATIREKLTGPPVVFNFGVYFTTYTEGRDDPCIPGKSRVWGVSLVPDEPKLDANTSPDGVLDFTTDGGSLNSSDIQFSSDPASSLVKWYEPQKPQLIRGVTITFRPSCSEDISDPANPGVTSSDGGAPQPELITNLGGTPGVGNNYTGNPNQDLAAGQAGSLNFGVKSLNAPESSFDPLSWMMIGN